MKPNRDRKEISMELSEFLAAEKEKLGPLPSYAQVLYLQNLELMLKSQAILNGIAPLRIRRMASCRAFAGTRSPN